MEISVKNINLETSKSPCIVTGIYDKKKLSATAAELDELSNGYILTYQNG